MNKGVLYLVPTLLGDAASYSTIPGMVQEKLALIDEFIVEDERRAKRYLAGIGMGWRIDSLVWHVLNTHTDASSIPGFLCGLEKGRNIGILSEAGCPCVADPGALVVRIAHNRGFRVVPLVGPSSVLLALMASGFNGQNFAFHGYLPKRREERIGKLLSLEKTAHAADQTQIFIETPFRSSHMFEDIVSVLRPETALCVACSLTLPEEFIETKSIEDWKRRAPDIRKKPCIFLLYRSI